jgi:predicted DNA-binding protein (UPF0251 family)
MGRPPSCRRVRARLHAAIFKPAGVSVPELALVSMTLDELEALRLADLEALYQEAAAARMRVSRSTFARVLESARRKVADALVHAKALVIDGGPVHLPGERCRCAVRRWREQNGMDAAEHPEEKNADLYSC